MNILIDSGSKVGSISGEHSDASLSDAEAPNAERLRGSVGYTQFEIELSDDSKSKVSDQLAKRGIPISLTLNLSGLSENKSPPQVIISESKSDSSKRSSDSDRGMMSYSPSFYDSGDASPAMKPFESLSAEQQEQFMSTVKPWRVELCKHIENFEHNEFTLQEQVKNEKALIARSAHQHGDADAALKQLTQSDMKLVKFYYDAFAEYRKGRQPSPQHSPHVPLERSVREPSRERKDLNSIKYPIPIGSEEEKKKILSLLQAGNAGRNRSSSVTPIGSEEKKNETLRLSNEKSDKSPSVRKIRSRSFAQTSSPPKK